MLESMAEVLADDSSGRPLLEEDMAEVKGTARVEV
jgi:hypothetical protein